MRKLKTIQGIVTFVSQRGLYTIMRLGTKVWLYVKNQFGLGYTQSYLGEEIIAHGTKEIRKNKPVYVTDKVEFKNSQSSKILSCEESILKMLKATGKHALAKKLQQNPGRLRRYSNNINALFFEDLVDIYTLLGIYRLAGMSPNHELYISLWLKHLAEEFYKNSTNVFNPVPRDSVPFKAFVKLIQQKIKECGVVCHTGAIPEEEILHKISVSDYVKVEDGCVYPIKVWNFKNAVFKRLRELGVRHTEYQTLREALQKERVIAVTGKAGTGKTTLVRKELQDYNGYVVYTATTGKAGKKLPNGITLHKWLGFDGVRFANYSAYADILVIDEASMLTWSLLNEVFLREWEKLILIGDPEQLPPVNEGYAFKMILSYIPQICLNEVKRGVMEVQVLPRKTVSDVLRTVLSLVVGFERKKLNYVVLSPFYDGALGVNALNKALSEIIQKRKVIITRNYYQVGLVASNGESGLLLESKNGIGLIKLETGRTVEVPSNYYTDGYCFSVHKAQGSEWDHVIFVKPMELSPELITSATTRARQKTYIVELSSFSTK